MGSFKVALKTGLSPRVRRCILETASIIPFLALGLSQAVAQPVGASVIAGQAQVLSSGATTVVNQNSANAIINWQDFSVGQGASVQFNQPSSSAITLNRVTGGTISNIDGAIRANGQVWLLNPNGVLFGNNARINVGGLLATTSDIANQDFLEGRYNFSGGNGEIVNNGKIRAHGGGSVILSAPRVTNRGLISARAGRVVLGGTDTFTVDFNGDRLLSYAIGASSQTGSVSNSGTVRAQGGQILMTARAASGVQDAVINNSGMAEATSARSVNGEIILDAGEGTATNSGTLNASGKGAGETGGTVKVLGRLAAVPDNAVIDVSGNAGGGTVMIGGNFQGKGSEQHAQATTIGKASINADAIASGNGGKVAVWSDGRTDFAGSITARGGAGGGNGGQVETSGQNLRIADSAFVSTLAARGKSGSWLLDPHNINIVNGGNDSATTGELFNDTPTVDTNIDPNNIVVALRGGNVVLQANNDITFLNNLTVTGGGNGNTLTLQAGRTIGLGASSISFAVGNVVMIANDSGAVAANRGTGQAFIQATSGAIIAASLDLIMVAGAAGTVGTIGTNTNPIFVTGATPTYISTPSTDVYITTGAGGSSHFAIGTPGHARGVDIGTGNLNLVVNGSQQTAPIFANNVTVTLPAGLATGNPFNWNNPGNTITGAVSIAAMGAGTNPYVSLINSRDLTVSGVSVIRNTTGFTGPSGPVSIQVQGGILTLTGNITTENPVDLSASGNLLDPGSAAIISAPQVSLNSSFGTIGGTGAVKLTNPSNTFLNLQASTATTGNINVSADKNIVIGFTGGNFGLKGGNLILSSTGTITQFSTGAPGTVTASNLQVAGSLINITGATVNSLSANAAGAITFDNTGNLQLNNLGGGLALVSSSSVTLSAAGSITQLLTANGQINVAGSLNVTAGGGTTTGILLGNNLNAVNGALNLNAPGPITFFNSVNTTVARASGGNNGNLSAFTVDIEVLGTGHTLTLNNSGNVINASNGITLHANGNIIAASNSAAAVQGQFVGLISDNGSIGSTTAQITLRNTTGLGARAAGDIYLNAATVQANGQPVTGQLNIGSIANLGPSGGNINGISAGGNIGLFLAPYDITGSEAIAGNNLAIFGKSIRLDNIAVTSLSAGAANGGTIDITSDKSLQLNNLGGGPAISTTGNAFISIDKGSLTQAAGASGVINAGFFSAYANTGNTLTNAANAISGGIEFGSLGDASLVNSLTTHLSLALAGGTLTVQSGGDLVLDAGPTFAARVASKDITIDNPNLLGAITPAQLTGTIISLRSGGDGIVLSTPGKFTNNFGATALVRPNGARFLIYSADPATDVFNGLRTLNAGIFATSYPTAITAAGSRYIFSVASSTNMDFIGAESGGGFDSGSSTAAAPALIGFVTAGKPPPRQPPPPPPPSRAEMLQGAGLPPPPPPPPPPGGSPLAAMAGPDGGNAEPPSSSDQATSFVASSLEGGLPPVISASSGPIIPRYLTVQPNPPIGTLQDPSLLPAFGNLSLWQ